MELIIKPTELCNFKCTFCSSPSLSEISSNTLDLNHIRNFLIKYPYTNTIIVNGGDPLMLDPQYYFKILDIISNLNLKTSLSLTSNLWDFYKHPDKWTELFKTKMVGVTTSFNYGNTRQISNNKVYTEEIFWKVSDLFLKKVGYRPDFISVITEDNIDTAIDNVYLANKMKVECKLNYAFGSGRTTKTPFLSDIYKIYIQIIKEGLVQYEYNSKQLQKIFTTSVTCPVSQNCDMYIRTLHPDGSYFSCGAFADDNRYKLDFETDQYNKPLKCDGHIQVIKPNCFGCLLYKICNGCHKKIDDIKNTGKIDEHCLKMKEIELELLNINTIK